MKKPTKKSSVMRRSSVTRSIKYASEILNLIGKDVKADKAAHRKVHVNAINANALVAHVVDILERGGVEGITSLPAWERAVRLHG